MWWIRAVLVVALLVYFGLFFAFRNRHGLGWWDD